MSVVKSRPYLWPFHGAIKPRQTALLVCNDSPETPANGELARLAALITAVRAQQVRLVYLPGKGLGPLFRPEPDDLVVERPSYGGFTGTSLDMVLRKAGLTDLLLAGFPAELGADCTMREANDLGYECLLLSDCCTGMSPDTLKGAISSVQMSGGIFGVVASAEAVREALEGIQEV